MNAMKNTAKWNMKGKEMSGKRSVETTRRRMLKRIERLEAKQKNEIDKLFERGDELSPKKKKWLTFKIHNISRMIETAKNVIKYQKQQSRGA